MDIGVFFYKNSFSEKGRSPTKMAEFLACGKPVIINKGIGDTEEILKNNNIGIVVKDVDIGSIRAAVGNIKELLKMKDTAFKCRLIAVKKYSLNIGVSRYQEIYNKI